MTASSYPTGPTNAPTTGPTTGPSTGMEHVESLLVHSDWIRGVARRLVRDTARADDLVQESWVAALRRPPRHSENLRGWLASVVRNQARRTARAESRREVRESVAARCEASVEDIAEFASTQRDVVGHVLALDEPFRSVVLLRFFENRTPPQIADRLDVPLKTVHSRLARAFDKLRDRLDREYGADGRWRAMLAPVAGVPFHPEAVPGAAPASAAIDSSGGAGSSFAPLLAVPSAVKLAAITIAAVLIGWSLWRLDPGGLRPDSMVELTSSVEQGDSNEPADPQLALVDAAEDGGRVPSAQAPPVTAASAPEGVVPIESDLVSVRGRVVDMTGQPVPDVAVHTAPDDLAKVTRTISDGSFELVVDRALADRKPGSGLNLLVLEPGWITVRRSYLKATNLELAHIVVVARDRALQGRVQDIDGHAITGARVALGFLHETFQVFPVPLDMTRIEDISAESDAIGRFEFSSFPDAQHLALDVTAPGFDHQRVSLDSTSWPLVIELRRPEETGETMLDGTVIDARGQVVEGAAVQLGSSRTKSGHGGIFRLPIPRLADHTPLCAAKPGFQPGMIPSFGAVVDAADGRPGPVEVVLGGPSLVIEGRVVDVDGAPCEGWTVSIADETEISQFRIPIDSAESLARSSDDQVRTGVDGGFRIEGLLDRDYVLQAYDDASLRRVERTVRAGGSSVELRVDVALLERVTGEVVASDGTPVSDVTLRITLPTSVSSVGQASIQGGWAVSDEEGRFELRDVPGRYVHLFLSGESILNSSHRFEDGETQTEVRIQVARRCHFQVELATRYSGVDSVRFEDADGKRYQVNHIEAGGMSAWSTVPLVDGKSMVLSVSEFASVLVLEEGSAEVARLPVQFDLTGVTQIRP